MLIQQRNSGGCLTQYIVLAVNMDTSLVEFASSHWFKEDAENERFIIDNYLDFAPVIIENDLEFSEEWEPEQFVGIEHAWR